MYPSDRNDHLFNRIHGYSKRNYVTSLYYFVNVIVFIPFFDLHIFCEKNALINWFSGELDFPFNNLYSKKDQSRWDFICSSPSGLTTTKGSRDYQLFIQKSTPKEMP